MITVPILFTFDESLEMQAGVCLTSLLANASSDTFYDIIILHNPSCDFSRSRINELSMIYKNCRIKFRTVVNEFVGGYQIRGIPETAYYRLIAPELIPEYDKILYSDVDVIFREDLSKFYQIELGNNYFAGVDSGAVFQPGTQKYVETKLRLDWRNGYYYSGNLIINLKLLRDNQLCDVFRSLGKRKFTYQDMDIINIACNKRFLSLGPSFCLTSYLSSIVFEHREEMIARYGEEEIQHALSTGIVHYNGPKPWAQCCLNMDIWWSYYRKSIFFDERFCYDFWYKQQHLLESLPLIKRIKMVLRYFIERKRFVLPTNRKF